MLADPIPVTLWQYLVLLGKGCMEGTGSDIKNLQPGRNFMSITTHNISAKRNKCLDNALDLWKSQLSHSQAFRIPSSKGQRTWKRYCHTPPHPSLSSSSIASPSPVVSWGCWCGAAPPSVPSSAAPGPRRDGHVSSLLPPYPPALYVAASAPEASCPAC